MSFDYEGFDVHQIELGKANEFSLELVKNLPWTLHVYMLNDLLPSLAIVHCAPAKTFLFRWKISIGASGRSRKLSTSIPTCFPKKKIFLVPF